MDLPSASRVSGYLVQTYHNKWPPLAASLSQQRSQRVNNVGTKIPDYIDSRLSAGVGEHTLQTQAASMSAQCVASCTPKPLHPRPYKLNPVLPRFVGGLSGLHTFFISSNRTTYEHFRARYGGSGNPYSRHCPSNWSDVCCTRIAPRYPENLVIPVGPPQP